MKSILIIHHCGYIGGAGISLLHVIRSIDKSKYKIKVLCPSRSTEMIRILKKEECEIIESNCSPKIFNHYNGGIKHALSYRTFINLYEIIKDSRNIKKILKENPSDIVILNSMTLFWIGKLTQKFSIKTICFHRETYQKGFIGFRSYIIKFGLRNWFNKVIFISNSDKNETVIIDEKSKVIYDKVEIDKYENLDKNIIRNELGFGNFKYILYLGGVNKLKGAHIIIDAMKYLKNDNVKLIFLGYDEKEKLKNLKTLIKEKLNISIEKQIANIINENELQNKIIFKKRVENPEIFYKACDLIVFPSTEPHQSRPIYEAGISKIPIIITNFKETEEFIKNEVNGIVFEKNNSIDLANKIKFVLNNKDIVKKIVDNNYKLSVKNHNYNDLKKEINNVLEFL